MGYTSTNVGNEVGPKTVEFGNMWSTLGEFCQRLSSMVEIGPFGEVWQRWHNSGQLWPNLAGVGLELAENGLRLDQGGGKPIMGDFPRFRKGDCATLRLLPVANVVPQNQA